MKITYIFHSGFAIETDTCVIEQFKVGLFIPMHFVVSGFKSAWRMKEFTDQKGIPFWSISQEGENYQI